MTKQPRRTHLDSMSGEVDRLLRQLGSPLAKPVPARATGPRPGITPRPGRPMVASAVPSPPGVWGRVALGVVLAVAMTQWPYRLCGLPLAGHLTGSAMVLVTGVWAGMAAWRARLGYAHVLAIALILAGVALGALQVMPRLGYAPVEVTWRCFP